MCCHLLLFADKDRGHFLYAAVFERFCTPDDCFDSNNFRSLKGVLVFIPIAILLHPLWSKCLLTTRSYTKSETIVMPCDHPSWYFDPEIGKTTQNQLRNSLRFFKSIHSLYSFIGLQLFTVLASGEVQSCAAVSRLS